MPFILSALILLITALLIRVVLDVPLGLLHWVSLPGWLGLAIALLVFSWLFGED